MFSIVDRKIETKLFDKRRAFPFTVINYPDLKYSNIAYKPSYGVYFSQIIRILRICNKIEYFNEEMEILTKCFLNKSYDKSELCNVFKAFLDKYKKEWGKFGVDVPIPNCLL